MRVVVPIKRAQIADLTYSGLVPSPYDEWDVATPYVAEDRVKVGESEYEAIDANTGQAPESSPDHWIYIGRINPLKAFDERLYDRAVGDGFFTDVVYAFTAPTSITAVAAFNLAARYFKVEVLDPYTDELLQEVEIMMEDDVQVLNWADYFFEPPSIRTELVIDDLQAYAGNKLRVTITPSGVASVQLGQLVVGRAHSLGVACEGTTVSLQDYSRKDRDEWGNATIVERPFAQRVEYVIAAPTRQVRAIQRALSEVRATPAVYYDADIDFDRLGITVYGYYNDFAVNLQIGDISNMSLEVEGLV